MGGARPAVRSLTAAQALIQPRLSRVRTRTTSRPARGVPYSPPNIVSAAVRPKKPWPGLAAPPATDAPSQGRLCRVRRLHNKHHSPLHGGLQRGASFCLGGGFGAWGVCVTIWRKAGMGQGTGLKRGVVERKERTEEGGRDVGEGNREQLGRAGRRDAVGGQRMAGAASQGPSGRLKRRWTLMAKARAQLQDVALASGARKGPRGRRESPQVPPVRGRVAEPGRRGPGALHQPGPNHRAKARPRRPRLRDGDFPPWMRNWACCPAA